MRWERSFSVDPTEKTRSMATIGKFTQLKCELSAVV